MERKRGNRWRTGKSVSCAVRTWNAGMEYCYPYLWFMIPSLVRKHSVPSCRSKLWSSNFWTTSVKLFNGKTSNGWIFASMMRVHIKHKLKVGTTPAITIGFDPLQKLIFFLKRRHETQNPEPRVYGHDKSHIALAQHASIGTVAEPQIKTIVRRTTINHWGIRSRHMLLCLMITKK